MTELQNTPARATQDSLAAADLLRSTDAVRTRAHALLARARRGESAWFTVHDSALEDTAALVAEVTRERYPDLNIPYHSRWRHFEAGGVNRAAWLNALLGKATPAEKARTQIDLALVSVLLDAGAGPDWSYQEAGGGGRQHPRHLRPLRRPGRGQLPRLHGGPVLQRP